MNQRCYLNGKFLPLASARISVLDRGFLFGDGVYEVIPVYAGKPFYWQRHLQRLQISLDAIRLPFDTTGLEAAAQQLIDDNDDTELALYLQITRGVTAKRRQAPPAEVSPTVFMMCNSRPPINEQKFKEGCACITMEDFRWQRCNIKSVSLLAAVLIAGDTEQSGMDEAVLLRDGVLSEGASCNYIIIHNRRLLTPVADNRILCGISYQLVLEIAEKLGYSVEARDIYRAELFGADEIWLTSSLREMLPVTILDGAPIGDGKVGDIFREVYAAWQVHTRTSN